MQALHGGDLDYAVRRYGLRREEIKDFSGNINPLGVSGKAKQAIADNLHMVSTYPDKNYVNLRGAIASYLSCEMESILVGNGSTELIALFIKTLGQRKAKIVAPVYSEYEREIALIGGESSYFPLKEEQDFALDANELISALKEDTGLLVICNPNNPTGTAISVQDMELIVSSCAEKGISVLVDETYCEFSDEALYSSIPLVHRYSNLFVIRGVAKFFAAPGLRLGYGVAHPELIKRMKEQQNPWSVNTLAAIGGAEFFADTEYIQRTKALIQGERRRVWQELQSWARIKPYRTQANFQLFQLLEGEVTSAALFEELIQKSLMIRDARTFQYLDERFIRFCFLKPEDNTLLLKELEKYCR